MYVGCAGGADCGGIYVVATVGGMAPPHRAGAALELSIISICFCVAAIAALNSSLLSLLRCAMVLLAMINAAKPSGIVSRIFSSFASVALFA